MTTREVCRALAVERADWVDTPGMAVPLPRGVPEDWQVRAAERQWRRLVERHQVADEDALLDELEAAGLVTVRTVYRSTSRGFAARRDGVTMRVYDGLTLAGVRLGM